MKTNAKLYRLPEKGRPYVIGGDTAGDGSDSFVGLPLFLSAEM